MATESPLRTTTSVVMEWKCRKRARKRLASRPAFVRAEHDYTIGDDTACVATRGIRCVCQLTIAHDQNSRVDAGDAGGRIWPRNDHADSSAGSGCCGSAAAAVCFESFAPLASTATGTCR